MEARPERSAAHRDQRAQPERGTALPPDAPAQRWRLTFAREADPDRRTHREVADQWLAHLRESVLPLAAASGRLRVPLTFAAPIPAGIACNEELADVWLRKSLPVWRVREALVRTMPARLSLRRLDDVWVGAPPLAAALRAADYRVALPVGAPYEPLEDSVRRFEAATSVARERTRGGSMVSVDIKPLIDHVFVDRDSGSLIIRARFLPDRGAGRPEDVLGTLESWIGSTVEWGDTTRERLILADQAGSGSRSRPLGAI